MDPEAKDTDPDPQSFIEWMDKEHHNLLLHYLTLLGTNTWLGKFVGSSPIEQVDPITGDLLILIHKQYQSLVALEFKHKIDLYIRSNNIISKYIN